MQTNKLIDELNSHIDDLHDDHNSDQLITQYKEVIIFLNFKHFLNV
jgi:hypothetical protein